jgi:hypothetical protein
MGWEQGEGIGDKKRGAAADAPGKNLLIFEQARLLPVYVHGF